MKQKTYSRWVGRRVRFKRDHQKGRVGTVVAPYKLNTWWKVEWPDGSIKLYPQRDIEIVENQ